MFSVALLLFLCISVISANSKCNRSGKEYNDSERIIEGSFWYTCVDGKVVGPRGCIFDGEVHLDGDTFHDGKFFKKCYAKKDYASIDLIGCIYDSDNDGRAELYSNNQTWLGSPRSLGKSRSVRFEFVCQIEDDGARVHNSITGCRLFGRSGVELARANVDCGYKYENGLIFHCLRRNNKMTARLLPEESFHGELC